MKRSKPIQADEVMKLLEKHAPISSPDLARHMKVGRTSLNYHMDTLHRQKRIYVSGWTGFNRQGSPVRLWSVGDQPDAEKPLECAPVAPPKESEAEKWERIMSEREAVMRARLAATIKPFRHWTDVALFGEPA